MTKKELMALVCLVSLL